MANQVLPSEKPWLKTLSELSSGKSMSRMHLLLCEIGSWPSSKRIEFSLEIYKSIQELWKTSLLHHSHHFNSKEEDEEEEIGMVEDFQCRIEIVKIYNSILQNFNSVSLSQESKSLLFHFCWKLCEWFSSLEYSLMNESAMDFCFQFHELLLCLTSTAMDALSSHFSHILLVSSAMDSSFIKNASKLIHLAWFSNHKYTNDRIKKLKESSLHLISTMAKLSLALLRQISSSSPSPSPSSFPSPSSTTTPIADPNSLTLPSPSSSPFHSHEKELLHSQIEKHILSSMMNEWMRLGSSSLSIEHSKIVNLCWKSMTSVLRSPGWHADVDKYLHVTRTLQTLFGLMASVLRETLLLCIDKEGSKESEGGMKKEKDARKNALLMKFFLSNCIRISYAHPLHVYAFANHFLLLSSTFLLLCHPATCDFCVRTADLFTQTVGSGLIDLIHKLLSIDSVDKSCQLTLIRSLSNHSSSSYHFKINTVDGKEKEKNGMHYHHKFDKNHYENGNDDNNGGNDDDEYEHEDNDVFQLLHRDLVQFGLWKTGQLMCMLTWMHGCMEYDADILHSLSLNLDWMIDTMSESNDAYPFLFSSPSLLLSPPQPSPPCPKTPSNSANHPWLFFTHAVHVLSTMAMVIMKREDDECMWNDFELFLFKNAFHVNSVCSELVLQVWEFVVRHSVTSLSKHHLHTLLTLLGKSVAHGMAHGMAHELTLGESDTSFADSADRLARVICRLVENSPKEIRIWVYRSIIEFDHDNLLPPSSPSPSSSPPVVKVAMASLLLKHGFSLSFLSETGREESAKLLSMCLMICKDVCLKMKKRVMVEDDLCLLQSSLSCICYAFEQKNGREIDASESYIDDLFSISIQILHHKTIENNINHMNSMHAIASICIRLHGHIWHCLSPPSMASLLTVTVDTFSSLPKSDYPSVVEMKSSLVHFLQNRNILSSLSMDHFHSLQKLFHVVIGENQWTLLHHALLSYMSMASSSSRLDQLWKFEPVNVKKVMEDCFPLCLIVKGEEKEWRKELDGHDLFTRALHAYHERLAMADSSSSVSNVSEREVLRRECEAMMKRRKINADNLYSIPKESMDELNHGEDFEKNGVPNVDGVLDEMEKKLMVLGLLLSKNEKDESAKGKRKSWEWKKRMEEVNKRMSKLQRMME